MLICVCFASNIRASYAFLLFCTKSVKLLGHQRQSTKSRETESTSRRSVDVLFLPHSWGECVHSAFLILQCNRASPCLENRRGIEAPSIRPPSLSGLSGHFTCGWVRAWKKSFHSRDELVFEAGLWLSHHSQVRNLPSLKGKCIICAPLKNQTKTNKTASSLRKNVLHWNCSKIWPSQAALSHALLSAGSTFVVHFNKHANRIINMFWPPPTPGQRKAYRPKGLLACLA